MSIRRLGLRNRGAAAHDPCSCPVSCISTWVVIRSSPCWPNLGCRAGPVVSRQSTVLLGCFPRVKCKAVLLPIVPRFPTSHPNRLEESRKTLAPSRPGFWPGPLSVGLDGSKTSRRRLMADQRLRLAERLGLLSSSVQPLSQYPINRSHQSLCALIEMITPRLFLSASP